MIRHGDAENLARDQRGAIMLIGLFMGVFLVALLYYAIGIGEAIAQREHMQDAADAAAFSAAVLYARGMNTIALVNMVMAALLAILLALKLVETLAGIAIVLISIASFMEPALATFIPGIQSVRSEVKAARTAIEPEIQSALETLHVLARGIRVVVPAAAQVRTIELVSANYSPPVKFGFVVPGQIVLPTQDAPFSQLCDRAGAYVGALVSLAIDPIAPHLIAKSVGDAADELARAPGDWYCSADSKPPVARVVQPRQHPTLPARAACIDYDVDRPDYDADQHERLCATAAREEQAARPDALTGACVKDCKRGGPYDQRVALARVECAPDAPGAMTQFSWVQRAVDREYVFHAGAWRVWHDSPGTARRVTSDRRPCGPSRGAIGTGWNVHVRASGSDEIEPVCRSSDGPTRPSGEGARFGPMHVIEVMQILGCTEDFVVQRTAPRDPNAGSASDEQDTRSPQMLADGAQLGEEAFQLRAYVLGPVPDAHVERVLELASWGDRQSASAQLAQKLTLASAATAGRSAFAQAEFYYALEGDDAAAERASFMWNMRWQARFRRFRLSQAGAGAAGDGAEAEDFGMQAATLDPAAACARAHAGSGTGNAQPCPRIDPASSDLVIH